MLLRNQAPILIVLTAAVPIFDKGKENNNWKKYLCVLQFVMSPLAIVTFSGRSKLFQSYFQLTHIFQLKTLASILAACIHFGCLDSFLA